MGGEIAYGGFSASANFVLFLEGGGKIFAKGNHPLEMAHGTQTLRQEVYIYQNMPVLRDIAPRFLGTVSDGNEDGWMLGLWVYIEAAPPAPPTTAAILKALLAWQRADADGAALKDFRTQNYISGFFSGQKKWLRLRDEIKVRQAFCALFVEPEAAEIWLQHNLSVLTVWQEKIEDMRMPEGPLHGDLRADNILQDLSGRVLIVDWPNACRGPFIFDLLFLSASREAAGGETIENFLHAHAMQGGAAASQEAVIAMAVTMAGFLADQARRAIPEKLPRLRWMQQSLLLVLLNFLERAGITESIPRMTNQV